MDRLVREGVKAIGLDPRAYSAHSLRAGLATYWIFVLQKNAFEVKKHLRHAHVAMLDVYVRDWEKLPRRDGGDRLKSPCCGVLGRPDYLGEDGGRWLVCPKCRTKWEPHPDEEK